MPNRMMLNFRAAIIMSQPDLGHPPMKKALLEDGIAMGAVYSATARSDSFA